MGFLFKKKPTLRNDNSDFYGKLAQAQQGNVHAKEELIKDYTPYILKVISTSCGRYVSVENDDEYSIGLIAFNEAIDKYDFSKGTSFFTFAEMVIKKRLIDYFRVQNKHSNSIVWSSIKSNNDEDSSPLETITIQESTQMYQDREDSWVKKQEILEYQKRLKEFNITLNELLELCPKHHDARDRAREVAKLIASSPIYSNYLLEKKALPLKLLSEKVNISRKTMERQRKYIIALAIVFMGDFNHLSSYLNQT